MVDVIGADELNPSRFIERQIKNIKEKVGDEKAFIAVSGGVDSCTVAALAYEALGDKLEVYFIENGLMREGEAEEVSSNLATMGMELNIYEAKKDFLFALRGVEDPGERRRVIKFEFYEVVFRRLLRDLGINVFFQGSIWTDIETTRAGYQIQHNVLGPDPEDEYGYKVLEPLKQLRKDGVRLVAEELGLPEEISQRMPFPGPALAIRMYPTVTKERLEISRKATSVVEDELKNLDIFQCMAILSKDQPLGVEGPGRKIEVRSWDSEDATVATPTDLSYEKRLEINKRLTNKIPEVVASTYFMGEKPPATMEIM